MARPSTLAEALRRTAPTRVLADFNAANVSAGVTAVFFYAFGAIPVFLAAVEVLGLTPAQASSWFFIIFMTSAIASVPLTLWYRQPIAIGWSIPGIVFLSTAGAAYTFPEILGANLLAGVAILLLGVLGIGSRIMRWIPLPLVLGMFAGSILGYATGIFSQLGTDPIPVGATLAGYFGARLLNRTWLPPIAGAVVLGLLATAVIGEVNPGAFQWGPPSIVLITPAFNAASIVTLVIPLVVMVISMGNVPGIGLLVQQGYRPHANVITSAVGLASIVNAFFGGHQGTLQRVGTSILASAEAGPADQRYVSNLVATVGVIALAMSAATASTLLDVLPLSLVAALAGLAILSTLMDSLRRTMTAELPVGSFFAFIIGASSLSALGIGAAFWALVGGAVVSLLTERPALLRLVRGDGEGERTKKE